MAELDPVRPRTGGDGPPDGPPQVTMGLYRGALSEAEIEEMEGKRGMINIAIVTIGLQRFFTPCAAMAAFHLIIISQIAIGSALITYSGWKNLFLDTVDAINPFSFPLFPPMGSKTFVKLPDKYVKPFQYRTLLTGVRDIVSPSAMAIFGLSSLQVLLWYKLVKVERQLPTSRREKWFGVIPRGWMTGSIFGLINAGLAFIYMDFTGWGRIENVDAECEYLGGPAQLCWNLQLQFIAVILGGITASVYAVFYNNERTVLSYPTVDLHLMTRLRGACIDAFQDCLTIVVSGLIFGQVVLSGYAAIYVTELFRKPESMYAIPFDLNMPVRINFSIWFSLLTFLHHLSWRVVEIFSTRMIRLDPNRDSGTSSKLISLADAMCIGPPHIKYLSFYEFYVFTTTPFNSAFIGKLFALSHPGDHPKNWLGVLHAVICETNKLTMALRTYMIMNAGGNVVPPSRSVQVQQQLESESSAQPESTLRKRGIMRNLAFVVPNAPPSLSSRFHVNPTIVLAALKSLLVHTYTRKVRPYLFDVQGFLREKDKTLELSNILATVQSVEWAVKGIVEVTCLSVVLDTHGVVQRDLHKVLGTLVGLHETIYKALQIPRIAPQDLQVIAGLYETITYSLGKVHGAFHETYSVLGISEELARKLDNLSLPTGDQRNISGDNN